MNAADPAAKPHPVHYLCGENVGRETAERARHDKKYPVRRHLIGHPAPGGAHSPPR